MIKIISHTDLDGSGCVIVIKILTGEDIDVSYCSYKNVDKEVLNTLKEHEKYSKIYITDISVSKETAKEIDKISDKVVLIDHHPTAKHLDKYKWATVEIEEEVGKASGTTLTYKHLTKDNAVENPSLDLFIELVRRFDTWEWQDKYNDDSAKKLNDLFYLKGKEDFTAEMIAKLKQHQAIFDITDITCLELRQKEIDRYIEKKDKELVIKEIRGYKAGVVFAENYISEAGNKLSELHPELDFIALVNQQSISYRTTKDDVNLSEIAKKFGGGGHPKASGSPVNETEVDKFIDSLFKESKLESFFRSIFKKQKS